MTGIEGKTPTEIAAELEAFVRVTAMDERFSGALVLVKLKGADSGAHFALGGGGPDERLQIGAMMMHLGEQVVKAALADGGKPPDPKAIKKPRRLVGIA